MQYLKSAFLLFFLALFFVSCSKHPFSKQTPKTRAQIKANEEHKKRQETLNALRQFKLIYINTPVFRFYDYGTIKTDKSHNIEITLYKLSQKVGDIFMTKRTICFTRKCSAKWLVARDLFGKVSYADLFDDIVLGRDIFKGLGKRHLTPEYVIQRFQKSGDIILYERKKGLISFQNLTQRIAIRIEQYEPSLQDLEDNENADKELP
ncbi:HP0838 family lipoprotein [Helicobacter cetorum]|uniref:Lipoprotein n=1 Tax=Helicobacter cetorum (strain ATCC BAA-540 / CCUG 52418 / MIT 99-5656) TaxID=1163745 RepID=I0EQZ1_HELCM|nr:hypothetical protein [Helicobacter cetorum]AFI05360.1 hypothetical protein HCD_01640 [Helicobacter cetorum MIT 99-5656]